jgi:ABC-2 type transport system permease protein
MVHDTPLPAGIAAPPMTTFQASDNAGIGVLAQLIICILAVLCATNEYSSGQIRATLTAAPGRVSTLMSKAAIIVLVSGVVTFVATYAAVLIGWPFISSFGVDDRFTWACLKIVLGMTLATVLVAVFALSVGFIVRNTAAGIGIVVAFLFVLSLLFSLVHVDWVQTMHTYMIDMCQVGLYAPDAVSAGYFDFLKSLWVTGLWAVVPLVGAGVLLKARDA